MGGWLVLDEKYATRPALWVFPLGLVWQLYLYKKEMIFRRFFYFLWPAFGRGSHKSSTLIFFIEFQKRNLSEIFDGQNFMKSQIFK